VRTPSVQAINDFGSLLGSVTAGMAGSSFVRNWICHNNATPGPLRSFLGALLLMSWFVDHLKIGSAPVAQEFGPGSRAMRGPDGEERSAMIHFG